MLSLKTWPLVVLILPSLLFAHTDTSPIIVGEEIVIKEKRPKKEEPIVSKEEVSSEMVNSTSVSLFDDLAETMKTLPGVVTPGDFSGELYIRGCYPWETIYLLDNVFIYWPYRWGGMLLFYNTDLIKKVDFYAGGYPAKGGQALGGIIDVYYKEGNKEKRKGALELSPTTARFQIEGHIRREKSSYYLATGRTHYDLWAKWLLGEEGKGIVLPYLDDHYLKLHFEPSFKDKISFTAVRVGEGMEMDMEEGFGLDGEGHFKYGYTRDIFALNHKRIFSPSLSNELTLSHVIDKADIDSYDPEFLIRSSTAFYFPALRNDITLNWGNHETKLGMIFSRITGSGESSLTYTEIEETDKGLTKKRHTRRYNWGRTMEYTGSYLWDRYRFGSGPILDYGLRYEYLDVTKETLFSPRLSLCLPIGRSRIKCALGNYSQYPLSGEWLDEKWGNPNLSAQRSKQYILGYEREIGNDKRIRIEGYYNDLSRLVLPDREKNYLNKGKGVSRGIEFFFQKKEGGRWDGWLSYAFSSSERERNPQHEVARAEEGKLYPIDQDRPHVASLVLNYNPGKGWKLGKKIVFYSGNPYTPIIDVKSQRIDERTTLYKPVYGECNSERLPNYFRVDLILTKKQKWGEWYLQCLNLTDHKNVYGYYYSQDYKEKKEFTMLPFMLLGGVKFVF